MSFIEWVADRLREIADRHWAGIFVLLIAIFCAGVPHIYPIHIDNTLDTLLQQGTGEEKTDRTIKAAFGDLDEVVILAYDAPELFTARNLRIVVAATDRIARIPGVRDCFSLASTPYFDNRTEEGELVLHTEPLLRVIPTGEVELRALKAKAVGCRLFLNNILSRDGNTAAFNIVFDAGVDRFAKEALVRRIRAVTAELGADAPGRFHLTGMHAFMETTGAQMQRDVLNFSLLSILLLFLLLYFIFESLLLTSVGLLTAVVANGLLFITLRALGRDLSISTTPVPAITMGLALAYTLHVLVAKHEGKLDDPGETQELFVGAIFSCATSVIGFATLCLNDIPTLIDFGLYAAIGTFYAGWTALFVAYPILKRITHPPRRDFARRFKFLLMLATARYRGAILACSALCFLGGLLIFRMEIQTDYYRYYLKSAPMTKAVDFVNRTIGGQYPIVVDLDTGRPDGVHDPAVLAFLGRFKAAFEGKPGVDKVITYLDLLDEGYKAFAETVPPGWYADAAKVPQVAMITRDADRHLNGYYLNADASRTLLFIRTSHINSANFEAIYEGIRTFLEQERPKGTTYRSGGTYIRCVRSADAMAWSQFVGTFTEIIVLFSCAFFVIGSASLTGIAFAANLLPVFGVYGLLSLLGETLNMGTTTIAAISLGIGVDDTIHFVVRYLNAYKKYRSPVKSTRHVIHSSGVSMLLAASMIALSFATLSLSNIKPIYQLGLYTVVTMALCFAANMFFVPVAIAIVYGKRKPDR